jgi:NADH:ubiquinone oxidoreductase subunit B-like Fe-S oxidoreductase
MQPFPLSIRPRFERMPAPAFGLAGGSATKTGGYNRLAGKT